MFVSVFSLSESQQQLTKYTSLSTSGIQLILLPPYTKAARDDVMRLI